MGDYGLQMLLKSRHSDPRPYHGNVFKSRPGAGSGYHGNILLQSSSTLPRIASTETPCSMAASMAPPAPTPSFTDRLRYSWSPLWDALSKDGSTAYISISSICSAILFISEV